MQDPAIASEANEATTLPEEDRLGLEITAQIRANVARHPRLPAEAIERLAAVFDEAERRAQSAASRRGD